ncbi:hypothetical protein QR680_004545 [Steinernema hermaphroditum]|uniref:Uncharacterized protein n=1 Tax=Steinernema hermaphroditum TaxID=289476 RepID=A0AA39HR87_9BILA|nr:hypothetical protein QR680_004545 [Steinernema hermaphroditum]
MATFARLFRSSKFVQLGDFEGRAVIGRIVHRVADDCYIDFGLKFPAVCKAPAVNNENFVIGSNVLLRLHTPELSERFLGSKRDLTLLEADATLLKLYSSGGPRRAPVKKSEEKAEAAPSEQEPERKTEESESAPSPAHSNS